MALGPLLEGRETSSPDCNSITRFMRFEQPFTDQKLDAALADLDRCGQDNAPGAALTEPSYPDRGWRFSAHVTG